MPIDQERFERLLARIDPGARRQQLVEQLKGKEGQPGLEARYMTQLQVVQNQQALYDRRASGLGKVSANMRQQAELELEQTGYHLDVQCYLLDVVADDLEKVQDAIEELDKAGLKLV